MLENGMIVGAERVDMQCREVEQGFCAHCKELVPVQELTAFANGERVCKDCMNAYLELNGADFVEEYISENEWAFYGDWRFNSLTQSEQLRELKAGCLMQNTLPKQRDELEKQKAEFCLNSEDFLEFVRGKLL